LLLPEELRKIESLEVWTTRRIRSGASTIGRDILRVETVLIVDLPFVVVAQDVVRFLNFLEPLFSRFISRVEVGMILTRQLAVSLPYLVAIGRASYA
jgi:hypothetical protein